MTSETNLKPGDLVELAGEPCWTIVGCQEARDREDADAIKADFSSGPLVVAPRQELFGDNVIVLRPDAEDMEEGYWLLHPSCLRRVDAGDKPAAAIFADREALCALLAYVHEEHEEATDPKEILQRALNGWPTMFEVERKPIRKAVDSALPAGDAKPEWGPGAEWKDGCMRSVSVFRNGDIATSDASGESIIICNLDHAKALRDALSAMIRRAEGGANA